LLTAELLTAELLTTELGIIADNRAVVGDLNTEPVKERVIRCGLLLNLTASGAPVNETVVVDGRELKAWLLNRTAPAAKKTAATSVGMV
jgi:hypothetical protein